MCEPQQLDLAFWPDGRVVIPWFEDDDEEDDSFPGLDMGGEADEAGYRFHPSTYAHVHVPEPHPYHKCQWDPVRPGRRRVVRRWTERELQRHHDGLANRLWPGRLDGWRVRVHHMKASAECSGFCDRQDHVIVMDPTMYLTDHDVRGTLLHEMCHAAVTESGHGRAFFTEVERLFSLGVPVGVDLGLYRFFENPAAVSGLPHCAARLAARSRRAETGRATLHGGHRSATGPALPLPCPARGRAGSGGGNGRPEL